MARLIKRDLGKEQEALRELAPQYAGFDKDPSIRGALEAAIRKRTTGTSRPVYEEDYNLPRLEAEVSRRPAPSQFLQQLQEKQATREAAEEPGFAKAFQGISDPRYREAAVSRARLATRGRLGELSKSAAGLFDMQRQESLGALERGRGNYETERGRQDELEAADIAEQKQIAAEQRAMQNQLMMQQLSGGGGRSGGGGGGSRGGGGRKSSGGGGSYGGSYGGSDAEGKEIMGQIKAAKPLLNQYGKGNMTREQLRDELIKQHPDIAPVDIQDAVYSIYIDLPEGFEEGEGGPF